MGIEVKHYFNTQPSLVLTIRLLCIEDIQNESGYGRYILHVANLLLLLVFIFVSLETERERERERESYSFGNM